MEISRKSGLIKKALFFGAAVFLVLCLSACAKPEQENEKIVFGICQANLIDYWQSAFKSDVQSEIDTIENAVAIFEDAGNSSQKQRIDIEDMIKRDVDVIIVTPCSDCDILANLQAARKAEIPVIMIGDYDINRAFVDMRIFSDNYRLGVMAGEKAVELLHGSGRILEMQDDPALRSTQDFKNGFLEGISEASGVEKEYVVQGYGTTDSAENALRGSEILELDTDIDLIFSHNSQMAIGARKVLQEKNLCPRILSIDLMSGSAYDFTTEQKKDLDCYLACPTGGREAVTFGKKLISGEEVPETYELEIEVITR